MNRLFNRLLDAALGIAPGFVLNNVPGSSPNSRDLAAKMKAAMNVLLSDAYDAPTQRFDYARVRASAGYHDLRECAAGLRGFDLAALGGREARLAFWINLYNALVIDAVIAFSVKVSVTKDFGFFRRAAYRVGDFRFSADDIEHGVLRGNRRHPLLPVPQFGRGDPRLTLAMETVDSRIHAALNCASRSCPPIAVYDARHIDEQLEQATRAFVNSTTQIDSERAIVRTSPIFKWYAADFGRDGILDWIESALDDDTSTRAWLATNRRHVRIQYSHYDWTLSLK